MANALGYSRIGPLPEYYYPDLSTALDETNQLAREQLYGPRDALSMRLNDETMREELARVRSEQAMGEAAPGIMANALAYATPVVGNVLAAKDAYHDAQSSNWLGASLGAIGAVPLLGYLAKALKGMRAIKPSSTISMASKSANIYDPPPKYARLISEDYPNGVPVNALGRITHDMDGRPIRAAFVSGRTGEAEVAADAGVSPYLAEISQGLYGTSPQGVAARAIGGNAGRFKREVSPDLSRTDYSLLYDKSLPEAKASRVQAHEISHGVDQLAGKIDTSGLRHELQTIYHDLNNPDPSLRAKRWTPEAGGYKGSDIDREYISEAIRAYMTDPNYMKAIAPKTAAAIRAAVNSNPRINHTLQFNSLAPLLGGALGYSAYSGSNDGQ